MGSLGPPLVLAGFALGLLALALRWRRAAPGSLERRQLSLLVVAAALVLALVALPDSGSTPLIAGLISLAVIALVPAAIGVAVLRHRLYDIDVVLNRSLVYAGLTGAIVILYSAMVWALGRPLDGGSWASALAIGLVGALVLPLRSGLQRLVDRAMYGDRGDPYAALSGLTTRLQSATAPGAALPAIVEAIAAALRLPYVAVDTTSGRRVEAGRPRGGPQESVPLVHQGQRVGELVVEGRDRRAVDSRDLRLLAELARPAGAAVSAAALADALSESRTRLVQAREEERRRLRRDLHDGLGPTLAGVALGLDRSPPRLADDLPRRAGAARRAERRDRRRRRRRPPPGQRAAPAGPGRARPGRALRQQPARLAHRCARSRRQRRRARTAPRAAGRGRGRRLPDRGGGGPTAFGMPAPRSLPRQLADGRCLRLEVADDGSGIVEGAPPGVGLTAMRERAAEVGGSCTVYAPAEGRGTRVSPCCRWGAMTDPPMTRGAIWSPTTIRSSGAGWPDCWPRCRAWR